METHVISSKDVVDIVRATLDYTDERLMGHGARVAYMIQKMLEHDSSFTAHDRVLYSMLGMLHDIGAFKTEEIDQMMKFESQNIWGHSVYGYLYLKSLSPLKGIAKGVLYHHVDYQDYDVKLMDTVASEAAGLLHLADRTDILMRKASAKNWRDYMQENSGIKFTPHWVDTFFAAEEEDHFLQKLIDGSYEAEFEELMHKAIFTDDEKDKILTMLAYSIDFRSEFMVLHTVTTVSVADAIAKRFGLDRRACEEIHYGALLHDIGKVSTPVEILEKPGRLTDQEMDIMRCHVTVSAKILGEYIAPNIKKIAVRHHEKLDGSGYPDGLSTAELSTAERIVAIADLVSALSRKRSYKGAFSKEETCAILTQMKEDGKICPVITELVVDKFDEILEVSTEYGSSVLQMYSKLKIEFKQTLAYFSNIFEVNEAS